jgi:hypothetical protein
MGIKNIKEVLVLIKVILLSILKEVSKDGFQWEDLTAFLKSPDFEVALKPAIDDIQKVGAEALDVDFFEGVSLGKQIYSIIMECLDVFKKKE